MEVWAGPPSLQGLYGKILPASSSSGGPRLSWLMTVWLQSLPPSLCLKSPSLIRTLNLITSAKIPFPNKVTFTGSWG